MNPVEIIREQRRNSMLQELAARPHRKRIANLSNIHSIGIVAHNLSDEDRSVLDQFNTVLTSRGSIMRKIELPANDLDLLDRFGFPKADFTQIFTTYQYDILIDITPPGDIFGLYLLLITSSYLRIGYQDTTLPTDNLHMAAHDFIIRGQGPCKLTHYLTQILTYLVQIRK